MRLLQGSVFDRLPDIEPGSVDCVVTSPPYWCLRSYLPKNHPLKPLELGLEKSPSEYIGNMVRVFRLVREAMADHATLWLNIGDTYSHARGKRKPGDKHGPKQTTNEGSIGTYSPTIDGIEEGSLSLIPQRLAIALQDDGWLVRSVVVWHKPAPMPASVMGWHWRRCRVKLAEGNWGGQGGKKMLAGQKSQPGLSVKNGTPGHVGTQWQDCPGCPKCSPNGGYVLRRGSWRPTSSWEPVLMLAKGKGYFCDGEAVKQPPAAATVSRDKYTRVLDDPDEQFAVRHDHETICDGANLRDVWTIAAEPLKAKHYAAFPSELVYRCLAAGTSSKGYCVHCGKPWCRVLEREAIPKARNVDPQKHTPRSEGGDGQVGGCWTSDFEFQTYTESQTIGWRPTCKCPEHTPRAGLVLDPFSGSGRTGIQAARLGLDFVGCELNPEYVQMSQDLIRGENPLFTE